MEEKQFQVRLRTIGVVVLAVVVFFTGTLYNLQVVHGASYLEQSTRKIESQETVEAARGEILDRYGRVLVSNRAGYQVTLDSAVMGEESSRNATLLTLLDICRKNGISWPDSLPVSTAAPFTYLDGAQDNATFQTFLEKMKWADVAQTGADALLGKMRAFFELDETISDADARALVGVLYELRLRTLDIVRTDYVFAKDVDIAFITAVKEYGLPGVRIAATTVRSYETTYAAHLLGRMGLMDADEWAQYKDLGYAMNESVGKDGVELAFEEYLRGTAGTRAVEYSTTGKVVSETWRTEPQPGSDVSLTLDLDLQEVVEESLAKRVPEIKSSQTEGAAVVVTDMTGGVLAMASYPTFDLSTIYTDASLYQAALEDPLKPLRNRATLEAYSPGSTFKMVTAIAGLEEGVITPSTRIKCTGRYTYYPRIQDQPMCWIFRQYGGTHGWETVTEAIRDSCNIFFYDTGRQLGIETLSTYAAKFGLGQKTGIEIAETAGVVGSREYAESLGQTWYEGNTMYVAIGQENTLTTPLQLANYVASLVNGGNYYPTHLLKSVTSADSAETAEEYAPEPVSSIGISAENLAVVKEGMREAAVSGSSASYFKDLNVTLGAKTGSAQIASESEANAVFVCFAPYDDPQIAISIVVEKGGGGAELGVIAADILRYYFDTDTDSGTVNTENTLLR
ncbi:MAG: penicillin-binding protein [Oscillospiraceae bacterium]|nr:penicillin-binding protein [Oscillospiraceae bacterium]